MEERDRAQKIASTFPYPFLMQMNCKSTVQIIRNINTLHFDVSVKLERQPNNSVCWISCHNVAFIAFDLKFSFFKPMQIKKSEMNMFIVHHIIAQGHFNWSPHWSRFGTTSFGKCACVLIKHFMEWIVKTDGQPHRQMR